MKNLPGESLKLYLAVIFFWVRTAVKKAELSSSMGTIQGNKLVTESLPYLGSFRIQFKVGHRVVKTGVGIAGTVVTFHTFLVTPSGPNY